MVHWFSTKAKDRQKERNDHFEILSGHRWYSFVLQPDEGPKLRFAKDSRFLA